MRTQRYGTRRVSSRHLGVTASSLLTASYPLGFVNAQYRFVMNPHGDYTVHFADPDMYVAS